MTEQQLYSQSSNNVWVIIPAAGSGQRMKSDIPKQYLKILDKTILEHTLDCFLEHAQVAGIVVVLSADDRYWQSLNITPQNKAIYIAEGGIKRSDSVIQGLKYLSEIKNITDDSWVLVHDAARPCLAKTDLDALLSIRNKDCVGGLLASPVKDTMKRAVLTENNQSIISHTEPRLNLWHALTPQMFRLGLLQDALSCCKKDNFEVTDECSAMEYIGENPIIVESVKNNLKITNPSDIAMASFLLEQHNTHEEQT